MTAINPWDELSPQQQRSLNFHKPRAEPCSSSPKKATMAYKHKPPCKRTQRNDKINKRKTVRFVHDSENQVAYVAMRPKGDTWIGPKDLRESAESISRILLQMHRGTLKGGDPSARGLEGRTPAAFMARSLRKNRARAAVMREQSRRRSLRCGDRGGGDDGAAADAAAYSDDVGLARVYGLHTPVSTAAALETAVQDEMEAEKVYFEQEEGGGDAAETGGEEQGRERAAAPEVPTAIQQRRGSSGGRRGPRCHCQACERRHVAALLRRRVRRVSLLSSSPCGAVAVGDAGEAIWPQPEKAAAKKQAAAA